MLIFLFLIVFKLCCYGKRRDVIADNLKCSTYFAFFTSCEKGRRCILFQMNLIDFLERVTGGRGAVGLYGRRLSCYVVLLFITTDRCLQLKHKTASLQANFVNGGPRRYPSIHDSYL